MQGGRPIAHSCMRSSLGIFKVSPHCCGTADLGNAVLMPLLFGSPPQNCTPSSLKYWSNSCLKRGNLVHEWNIPGKQILFLWLNCVNSAVPQRQNHSEGKNSRTACSWPHSSWQELVGDQQVRIWTPSSIIANIWLSWIVREGWDFSGAVLLVFALESRV